MKELHPQLSYYQLVAILCIWSFLFYCFFDVFGI